MVVKWIEVYVQELAPERRKKTFFWEKKQGEVKMKEGVGNDVKKKATQNFESRTLTLG